MPSLRLVPQQSLREVAQLQPEEIALLTEPPAPMCPRVATVRVMGSTLVQPIWLRYDPGVLSFSPSYRHNGQGVSLPNAAVVSVCLSVRANGQRRVVVEGTIQQVSRRRHSGDWKALHRRLLDWHAPATPDAAFRWPGTRYPSTIYRLPLDEAVVRGGLVSA